jgi:poly(ADP-ribose) glycohydrolase
MAQHAPPLPCALPEWPAVRVGLQALAAAPPTTGAALVAALVPLRAALHVRELITREAHGLAAFFHADAESRRAAWLLDGGLAGTLALAARLDVAVRESDAACADAPLRLLLAGAPGAASLTRAAAASLMAVAFLCLMPGHAEDHGKLHFERRFPTLDFRGLWETAATHHNNAAKLDCHLHYLKRAGAGQLPPGTLRFERRVLDAAAHASLAGSAPVPLCQFLIEPRVSICTSAAPVRADFANCLLGGGALFRGCVQEEILFSQRPELCVGMLLCEKMRDDEAIMMRGAACYSATSSGYGGDIFKWEGVAAAHDSAPHDYVAFDAADWRDGDAHAQWRPGELKREVHKALVAFAQPGGGRAPAIASGNWGCGAFEGYAPLKALLQWVAASLARCDALHYHAFGELELAVSLAAAVAHVQDAWPPEARTAGGLYAAVKSYAKGVREHADQPPLLDWLRSDGAQAAAAAGQGALSWLSN